MFYLFVCLIFFLPEEPCSQWAYVFVLIIYCAFSILTFNLIVILFYFFIIFTCTLINSNSNSNSRLLNYSLRE